VSVVDAGLVRNNNRFPGLCSGAAFLPDTLLGPETTPVVVLVLLGIGCGVVAPSWWWGVVFVYWIVVASI
jgi:hypothetical protein